VRQASGPPDTYPTSGPPQGYPTSGPPHAYPTSGPPQAYPASGPPQQFQTSGPPDTFAADPFPPGRRIEPSKRSRRPSGRLLLIAAVVLVLLVAGGTTAWLLRSGGGTPDPKPTAQGSVPPVTATLPGAAPSKPGREPPRAGGWPKAWPSFNDLDRVRTLSDLNGVGFTVKVPKEWQCAAGGQAPGLATYNCGGSPAGGSPAGGEITVRDCAQPCDGKRQTAMRRAEEAWGLQWIRVGSNASYAESSNLEIDGRKQYGLVVVAYFRSGPEGDLNRQVVLRMTADVDRANLLRRVANYVRAAVIF
jgi:hypothetical protein